MTIPVSPQSRADTTHTEPVAAETARLASLVASARYVLWDLDGPICRRFAGYPAAQIAREPVANIDQLGMGGLLTQHERSSSDPQVPLRAVHERRRGSDLSLDLEEWLTRRELEAVPTAMPTPYADPLIRTWVSFGVEDLEAARQAGVSFLGYAGDTHKAQVLMEAGAEVIVISMKQVLDVLRSLPALCRQRPGGQQHDHGR